MAKNAAFRVAIDHGTDDGTTNRILIVDNRGGDQPLRISSIQISVGMGTTFNTMNETGRFRLYKSTSAASQWTGSFTFGSTPGNGLVCTRTSPFETAANAGDTRALIFRKDPASGAPFGGYTPTITGSIHADQIDIATVAYNSQQATLGGCTVQVGEGIVVMYEGSPITQASIVINGVD
jgi:hypothetical protein